MRRYLATLMMLLLPAIALASSGEAGHGGGIPWKEMVWHGFNLAVLAAVLYRFAAGPIRDAVKDRAMTVKKDLDESHALRKEAQDRYDELEAKLAHFEQRLEETRTEAATEAEAEAKRIAEKTAEDIAWIREAAQKTIRDELAHARRSLQREAVELAVTIASETLAGRISAEDQDRLARDLIGTVSAPEQEANRHG